ncbi:SDR family oxidoreductase [Actinocatenispora comari]|uniref:3-oxoacyl-ACP reductase n=1 Tax=Actinocatenispora comari TaxID=2807577 RepID=A0A8J4AGC9_9ACTN|nr:SDR family oxidoreductase [Actinocatenispora comari]GIL30154.1 3-oxoacyl-ACP reductase [Actinocatenispora comari]
MGALDGKTALVTGASRGIGRAIAERLAADGAVVAVHYHRGVTAAHEVVTGIRERGGVAFGVRAELGVPGDVDTLLAGFDTAITEYDPRGGLDILVNNAAIGTSDDLAGLTPAGFDTLFAVNVKAPMFLVQQALSRLRDGGRIVNISSGVTRIALPDIIGYAATKGAVEAFSHNLAKQLGPRGITVNAVSPGIVETDVNPWLADPERARWAADFSAFGRVGQPDDIADVVAFVVGDDARWVTGQVLDATGGSAL